MSAQCTLGELETGEYHPIYTRADGTNWMKLNATFHVRAHRKGVQWIGNGSAEMLDPRETVTVLHLASERAQ